MRYGLDVCGLADGLVWGDTAFGVEEMRSEDGVNERGLAQAGLACFLSAELGVTALTDY